MMSQKKQLTERMATVRAGTCPETMEGGSGQGEPGKRKYPPPFSLSTVGAAKEGGAAGKRVLPRPPVNRSGVLFRGKESYAMPALVQKRCRNAAKWARVAVPPGFRVPFPVPWTIPLPTAQLMASWA